ncbi:MULTISPECIES: flagellar export chaperone FliS [Bacillaceae]|uniref:Flagellar secretion chaperone FliS n=2 Tax=Bacillaceae TaxID=186817 RepID=A0A9D5DNU4_9BACI|nr:MULTISPECIES: flagellar export chaperone FliS [Bacillaceae]KQL55727.1 flagellar export chaperone FliS [Alkalicoccobacillus plakortidis]MBG9783691.1 flagellar biosynthesis protein FliS [Shouchella lehensis]RQW21328.1 flagellar export chaperone FliS [Bacillus sp. C1-1]TES51360.1 flagellar export chaperone FliS [Shouchella lehensis]
MLKQAAYKQQSVQTASPGELTLMLYNGCLKQLRVAENAIKESHFQQKNEALTKAEAIIKELMITLKTDTEVGENMMRMYEYIHYQLIEANIKSDLTALQEAQGYVVEFRDTWKEVIKLDRQNRFGGVAT